MTVKFKPQLLAIERQIKWPLINNPLPLLVHLIHQISCETSQLRKKLNDFATLILLARYY